MGRRVGAVQLAWLAQQGPAWLRLRAATRAPERAQSAVLRRVLGQVAGSAYGRAHGLHAGMSLRELQRAAPIVGYEVLRPWVSRVEAGEAGVLSTGAVELLEPTSGSTSASKLIPYTAGLRAEFSEAVGAWMVDLHRSRPGLLGSRSYWSVSQAVKRERRTAGGVPIGLADDGAYFGPLTRRALPWLMAVPGGVAAAPDMASWRRQTLIHLVEAGDLGLISVWSPSFLAGLLDGLLADLDGVAAGLSVPRRRALLAATAGGELRLRALWPRLALLSCWTEGFAGRSLAELLPRLDGLAVQGKGVLATEGVVSVPVGPGEGCVLALGSHVIELRPVGEQAAMPAWEAELGQRVEPVLTQSGGLVRYALGDVLEVVGFSGRAPRVRLVGRVDKRSDLVGEKLDEGFVAGVMEGLLVGQRGFVMLVPRGVPWRYVAVVDGPVLQAEALEAALGRAYHYAYARELGQLGAVEVLAVPGALSRWEAACVAEGQRLGDLKPGVLERRVSVAQRAFFGAGEG